MKRERDRERDAGKTEDVWAHTSPSVCLCQAARLKWSVNICAGLEFAPVGSVLGVPWASLPRSSAHISGGSGKMK